MPSEPRRGCGYRHVGSLYLCGSGMSVTCDGLPLVLKPCHCCGFEAPFTRNLMRIKKDFVKMLIFPHVYKDGIIECRCYARCPICYPDTNRLEHYGLMWVGERHYTPSSFVKEAVKMGVSKKIPDIPTWLEMGKTWVLLAHKKVELITFEDSGLRIKEPEYKPAIFYAFRPQRIEMPIWKSQATLEYVKELAEKGITPIVINDGDLVHASNKKNNQKRLEI